jgi:hypothetical protein
MIASIDFCVSCTMSEIVALRMIIRSSGAATAGFGSLVRPDCRTARVTTGASLFAAVDKSATAAMPPLPALISSFLQANTIRSESRIILRIQR